MSLGEITEELIAKGREAFLNEGIEVLLGFEKSSSGFLKPKAFFFPDSLKTLRWDASASTNLAALLPKYRGKKIGILAPGCVSRSLVILINEGQIVREKLKVIGIPCPGVIDRRKLGPLKNSYFLGSKGGKFLLESDNQILELPLEEYLCDCCLSCRYPSPVIYDYMIQGKSREGATDALEGRVKKINSLSEIERLSYFQDQAEKCIRCYACRQACPMCYCESCFVESSEPRWLTAAPTIPDNLIWLLTRTYHLAGRCVECGACEQACPEGVDLMSLLAWAKQTVSQLFNYTPGLEIGERPALGSFSYDDPDFFWGGGLTEEKKCCT